MFGCPFSYLIFIAGATIAIFFLFLIGDAIIEAWRHHKRMGAIQKDFFNKEDKR